MKSRKASSSKRGKSLKKAKAMKKVRPLAVVGSPLIGNGQPVSTTNQKGWMEIDSWSFGAKNS